MRISGLEVNSEGRPRCALSRRVLALPMVVLGFCWLSTLGVFCETVSNHAMSGDVEAMLRDGQSHITARAYIGVGDVRANGIPFVWLTSADHPPFPLYVVLEVKGMTPADTIEVVSVVVGEDKEHEELISQGALRGHFRLVDIGNHKVRQSMFIFDKAIDSAKPSRVVLTGRLSSADDNVDLPFEIELRVPFRRAAGWTTGWIKILYYDQF